MSSILSPLILLKTHSNFSIDPAVVLAPAKTSNLANFSVAIKSSVVARFRAMQLLAPFPNGRKSRFISAVASSHRSGLYSSGCGNTLSSRCSWKAATPTLVPAGKRNPLYSHPLLGTTRGSRMETDIVNRIASLTTLPRYGRLSTLTFSVSFCRTSLRKAA